MNKKQAQADLEKATRHLTDAAYTYAMFAGGPKEREYESMLKKAAFTFMGARTVAAQWSGMPD